tara:strand:+ start:1469 stop:1777 length:309 start_codon:yes stop_codon:yes gene_type:complete
MYGSTKTEYVHETFIEALIDKIARPGKPVGPEELVLDFRGYCVEQDGVITCDYIQVGLMPREALVSKPPSKWWVPRGESVSDDLFDLVLESREAELEELRHG